MKTNENNFNEEPNFPSNMDGKNTFGLPANYFDAFEDKLRKKLELKIELEEFKTLNSIVKTNTFLLPTHYFSELEISLDYKSELAFYPKLDALKPQLKTYIDTEYQAELTKKLFNKFDIIDELKEYSILSQFDKQNNFTYPEAYFESIAENIKEKVYAKKTSLFDLISHYIFSKKLIASFGILVIIFFTWFLFPKTNSQNIIEGNCKTLACLEKQEILNNAHAISSFDDEQLIELVNIKSLNNQLINQTNNSKSNLETDSFLNNTNLDEIIDEL